jgi:rubrerythrin
MLDYFGSASAGASSSAYSTSIPSFTGTARHPADRVVYIRVAPDPEPILDVWKCAYCGGLRTGGMTCPGCGAARPHGEALESR